MLFDKQMQNHTIELCFCASQHLPPNSGKSPFQVNKLSVASLAGFLQQQI